MEAYWPRLMDCHCGYGNPIEGVYAQMSCSPSPGGMAPPCSARPRKLSRVRESVTAGGVQPCCHDPFGSHKRGFANATVMLLQNRTSAPNCGRHNGRPINPNRQHLHRHHLDQNGKGDRNNTTLQRGGRGGKRGGAEEEELKQKRPKNRPSSKQGLPDGGRRRRRRRRG